MVWHDREIHSTTDPAASAVLEAFDAAQAAHLPSVICYRAGVDAWRRIHPDQEPKYAALQAVDVILAAKVKLRVATMRDGCSVFPERYLRMPASREHRPVRYSGRRTLRKSSSRRPKQRCRSG